MAKHSKQKPKHALTRALAEVPQQVPMILLQDVRTMAVACERLLSPESIKHGLYRLKADVCIRLNERRPPVAGVRSRDERPALCLQYDLHAEGLRIVEHKPGTDDKQDNELAFTVRLAVEAFFTFQDKALEDLTAQAGKEVIDGFAHVLAAEVHPLLLTKVRGYAADMGYRGFAPPLGLRERIIRKVTLIDKPIPQLEAPTDAIGA